MKEYVITKQNFAEEVLNSDKPVLLDFWASWCGPCRMLSPVVSAFAQKHPEIKVGKVNVDEESFLAGQHRIMSIPALVVYNNGKITNQTVGYRSIEALEELFR